MKKPANHKTLAQESLQASVWKVRPFQIVSLLEMLEHRANLFYSTTRKLYRLANLIDEAVRQRGSDSLPTEAEADEVRRLARCIEHHCDPIEFSRVLERLDSLNRHEPLLQPLGGRHRFTVSELRFQLGELNNEIARTLGEKKFLMIPSPVVAYYDNPELFGPDVASRFPKANAEITEAGKCYATGNNTACVFHLMRAVELGTRVLVKRLGILKSLPHPVELCDWGMISRELQKAVANLPKRTSVRASEMSAFYSQALAQFLTLKDAWRNHVAHTRASYDEYQAKSVMITTQHFLEHLALKLREQNSRK